MLKVLRRGLCLHFQSGKIHILSRLFNPEDGCTTFPRYVLATCDTIRYDTIRYDMHSSYWEALITVMKFVQNFFRSTWSWYSTFVCKGRFFSQNKELSHQNFCKFGRVYTDGNQSNIFMTRKENHLAEIRAWFLKSQLKPKWFFGVLNMDTDCNVYDFLINSRKVTRLHMQDFIQTTQFIYNILNID
jgi:hypothetical protein